MANEPLKKTNMGFATLLLTTSFIVGSIAGPLTFPADQQQCSLTCSSENNKFDYEIGKTYIYKYVADTETRLQSEGSEQSRLRIQAQVEIEPISKCDYILRLKQVSLEDPGSTSPKPVIGSDDFRTALEQYPLRFGFQDGRIENLCPYEKDPIWVLNIKRGILSTFQNAMENFQNDQSLQETDITGRCLSHYKVTGGGWRSTTNIQKTRDLTGCTDRTDHYTSFQTNPYHPNIASKTAPLVKSDHSCEQTIQRGQLQSSSCKEKHAFQPFSNQKSGAVSTTIQNLSFQKEEQGKFTKTGLVSKRATLLFDHKYRELGKTTDEKEAEEALKELCAVASDDIRPEVPRLFSRLVHKLQELNYEKLSSIYNNVHSICNENRKAKKFLYDAVPLTGSDAGVTLMRDLILRHEISKTEADTWLLMLGFLPRPSKEIITAMMPLLDRPEERPKALLGVSALTYSYCKVNPDCGQEAEVKNLVKKLVINLKDDCKTVTDQAKETVIVTLKALGNIGHIDDGISALENCYKNVDNPIDVRLAALDAFRRLPCTRTRESLFKNFFNFEEDSEVRIGTYLAAMKCPTPEILAKIQQNLNDEEVNQVGSFVWTHLTSLQETSDPYKQEIRKILSNKKLQKKFSTDVRKFSRYLEGSIFFDSLKTGALAEGTIVFSPKSYLPRSTSLGLTVDIFGESINLFEVGGRVEGFEFLVESFFGPKGYFPDDTIAKILESAREKKTYNEEKLNEIAKIFNMKHYSGEDPRGSVFMRIFGNEISVLQFRGIEQLLQRSTAGFNIIHELIQLTQKEDSEYTKSFMFIDSSLIVPTAIGLPLNLTVNGTATVNLRVGGKLDLSRMRSKSLQLKVNVEPSAAVEVASSMVVDAFVARSGLKMVATMHTSTYANAEVFLENGEVLRAHIDMPKDKMEVFEIQNNLFLLDGRTERKHLPLVSEQVHLEKCTGSGLSNVLGLQLCGEIDYPLVENNSDAPTFLLAGPMAAKIYLEKTDKAMTSYNLDYRWDKRPIHESAETPYVRIGRFSLNTPRSTVNRELSAEFNYNEEDKTISVHLISPIKTMSFSGKIVNDKDYKKLDTIVQVDGKEKFSLQSGLRIEKTGSSYRLTPDVTMHFSGQPVLGVKGFAQRQEQKKYNAEITVEHVTVRPITIKGSLTKSNKIGNSRHDADFTVQSSAVDWYTKWFMQTDDSNMATKGTIEYRFFEHEKQMMTFSAKSVRSLEATKNTLDVEANFQCSAHPNANWDFSWKHQRDEGHMENTLAIFYGAEEDSSHNTLSIQHSYDRQGSWVEHRAVSDIRILFPPGKVDTTISFSHELTKRSLETNLLVKHSSGSQTTIHLDVAKRNTEQELIRGQAWISWPGHRWEVSGDVQQPTLNELVATVRGKWAKDSEARAVITLRKQLGAVRHDSWGRQLIAEFQLPNQEPVVLSGDVLLNGVERSVHGQVQLNGRKYRTFAEYHRPSLENVRLTAGANSPSTEYSASAKIRNAAAEKALTADVLLGEDRRTVLDFLIKREGRRKDLSASVIFDANRTPNATYSLGINYEVLMHGFEGVATVRFPLSHEIGFRWNVSRHGLRDLNPYVLRGRHEVWHNQDKIAADVDLSAVLRPSSRDVKASFQVTTPSSPYHGFRVFDVTASHMDDGKRWSNNALARVDGQSLTKVTSQGTFAQDENGTLLQATVKVELPLEFAPTLLFGVDLRGTRRDTELNVTAQWAPGRQIELAISEVDDSSAAEFNRQLSINLTTPFSWARDTALVTRIIAKDKTMVQAEFRWEDRRFFVDYEASVRTAPDKIDTFYFLQLSTPFKNLESLSSSVRFRMDPKSTATILDFSWAKDKRVALEVVVANDKSPNLNSLMTIHLVSPYRHFEDVLLTLAHQRRQDHEQYRVELQWAPNATVAARFHWKATSPKDFDVKVEVDEPLGVFDHFVANVQYKLADDQLSAQIAGLLKDKAVRFDVDFLRKIDVARNITGLIRLMTSFDGLKAAHLQLVHRFTPNSTYTTKLEAKVNERLLALSHDLSYQNAFNFNNLLSMKLPLEPPRVISLKTLQSTTAEAFQHESEIGWVPGRPFSIAVAGKQNYVLVKKSGRNFASAKTTYEGSLRATTPWNQYGPFGMLASQELDREKFKNDVAVEYWPGQKVKIASELRVGVARADGRWSIDTPSGDVWSLDLAAHYNGRKQFTFQDFVRSPQQHLDASVKTPVAGYELTEANFSAHDQHSTKVGRLKVQFAGKSLELTARQKMDDGIGYLNLTLVSPFRGYENVTLWSEIRTNAPDRRFSFHGDSGPLKVDINAFHDVGPKSMDTRVVFTSSIPGVEQLKFRCRYDATVSGEKTASISVEKGIHKVELAASSQFKPEESHMNITFASLFDAIKWMKFDARFTRLGPDQSIVRISVTHNTGTVDLTADMKGGRGNGKVQVDVSLTTPFESLERAAFVGRYDLDGSVKFGEVSLSRNNDTANLRCELERSPEKLDVLVVFVSPMEGAEAVSLKVTLKKERDSQSAAVKFERNSQLFEAVVESTQSVGQGSARIVLKTPIAGYHYAAGSVEYDDKKLLKVVLQKDQQKITIYTHLFTRANVTEAGVTIATPIAGFEHLSVIGQMDASRPKSLHVLTWQKGSDEYKVTWEFEHRPSSYLDYKLQLKTPSDDRMLYANYNLNGANAVTFDAKYMESSRDVRLKRMMEFSGRFWKQPDRPKADASLTFNANFPALTAVSVSGRYDLTGAAKEAAFKADFSGQKIEMTGSAVTGGDRFTVNVQGNSSIGKTKTFRLVGTVVDTLAEKAIDFKLMTNEADIQVVGKLLRGEKTSKGVLEVKAPAYVNIGDSLLIEVTVAASGPEQSIDLVFKKDGVNMSQVTVNHRHEKLKMDTTLKMVWWNHVSGLEPVMTASLSADWSGRRKKIDFELIQGPVNTRVGFVGSGDKSKGEATLSVKANEPLPWLNAESASFQMKYDRMRQSAMVSASVAGKELCSVVLESQLPNVRTLTVRGPDGTAHVFRLEHDFGTASKRIAAFEWSRNERSLVKASLDLQPESGSCDFVYNVSSNPIHFSAQYEVSRTRLGFDIKCTEGGRTFQLGGFFHIEDGRYETSLFLKSPNPNLEELRLEASLLATTEVTTVTWSGRWSPDRQVLFSMEITPGKGASVVFTSPFDGYEKFGFVAEHHRDASSHRAALELQLPSATVGMRLERTPGRISIVLNTPLAGFKAASAVVSYDSEPFDALLVLQLGDEKIEVGARVDLQPKKGSWKLSFATPFDTHEAYLFEGVYDFVADHEVAMLAKGQGQFFGVQMRSRTENDGRSLGLNVTTPSQLFGRFEMVARYDLRPNDTEAALVVYLNDQMYRTAGHASKGPGQLKFNFRTHSADREFLSLSGEANATTTAFSATVLLKRDERPVLALTGVVEHRLPYHLRVSVRVSAPTTQLTVAWFTALFEASAERTKLVSSLTWNDDQKIRLSGLLSPRDVHLNLSTPFARWNKVQLGSRWITKTWNHFLVAASIEVDSVHRGSMEVQWQNQMPRLFEANFQVATSFGAFDALGCNLKFTNYNGRIADGKFELKTPFAPLPQAEAIFRFRNDHFEKVDALVRLELPSSRVYSLEMASDVRGVHNTESKLVVRTPHLNYETITLMEKTTYVDSAERGVEYSLTTPTGKHGARANIVLKPGNIGFELATESPLIPQSPIGLQGRYDKDGAQARLAFSLTTATYKTLAAWTRVTDTAGAYKGAFALERTSSATSAEDVWSVEYLLDTPAPGQLVTVVTNLIHQQNSVKNQLASVSLILTEGGMDANMFLKRNSDYHRLAAKYQMTTATAEGSFNLTSPLLASRSVALTGTLRPRDAVLKLYVGATENVLSSSLRAKSPAEYEGIVKLDAPSLDVVAFTASAKLKLKSDSLKGELNVRTPTTVHHASASVSRSPTQIATQFALQSPYLGVSYLTLDGLVHLNGDERQVNSVFTANFGRQTHRLSMDLSYGDTLDCRIKLETPLLQSRAFALYLRLSRTAARSGTGLLKVTTGGEVHEGIFEVECANGANNAHLSLETSILGIDSVSLKFSLKNNVNDGFDASVVMNTPKSAHSLNCRYDKESSQKHVHVDVYSPYLDSVPYSLTATIGRDAGSRDVSLTLHTGEANHTVTFGARRSDKGSAVLQAIVTTPWFDLNSTSLTATVAKMNANELEATLELNYGGRSHVVNVDVQRLENRKLAFDVAVQMPFFDVGALSAVGQLELVGASRVNVEVIVTRSGKVYSVDGDFGWNETGVGGHFQLASPFIEPIELSAQISRLSLVAFDADVSVKTAGSYHGLQARLRRKGRNFDFRLGLDSTLLPCQSLTLAGNFAVQLPVSVVGSFTLETPGRAFRFLSNYRNDKLENMHQGGFTIVTPFQSLPLLKVSGKLAQDAETDGFDGGLEMHTVEDGLPEVAFYIKYQTDADKNTLATVTLQIPMFGYRDVTVDYGSQILNDSSRYSAMKLKANGHAYGYECTVSRKPNHRSAQFKLYAGPQTFSLQTTAEKDSRGRKVSFFLETPLRRLQYVNYEVQYGREGSNRYTFRSVLNGEGFKWGLSGDLTYDGVSNFDGSASVETPLSGYQKVAFRLQQKYSGGQLRWSLEQLLGDRTVFQLLLENTHERRSGNGKLQLTTPFQTVKTASAFYKYDGSDEGRPSANLGLHRNGQTLLRVNTISKNDVRVVEVINPIQPILIEYSYVVKDGNVKIRGEYCWDAARRSEATIGFDVKVTVTQHGAQIVVSSIHPEKPLALTVFVEMTPTLFLQRTEVTSFNTKSSYFYEIRSQRSHNRIGDVTYDTTVTLAAPFRALQLTTQYENDGQNLVTGAQFKWDALKDSSKAIGIRLEHNDRTVVASQRNCSTDVSFLYPNADQKLTLHWEYATNPLEKVIFVGKCTFGFATTPSEMFTIQSKVSDVSSSPDQSGYEWEVKATHPESNLDVGVMSNWINTSREISGGIKLYYADRHGEMKNVEVTSKIIRLRKQIQMMMKSPLSKLEWSAQMNPLPTGYSLHLESRTDDQHPVTADLQLLHQSGPMAELSAVYDPGMKRSVNIRAGMEDMKTIMMKAYHQYENDMTNDMNLLMNLNRSREFITRFYWRPGVLQEIEEGVGKGVRGICSSVRIALRGFASEARHEFHHKYNRISESFTKAMSPVALDVAMEFSALHKDAKIILKAFHQMYLHNEFYLRNIYDAVDGLRICKQVCIFGTTLIKSFVNCYQSVVSSTTQMLVNLQEFCDYLCNNITAVIRAQIQDLPYAILHFANELTAFGTRTINDIALRGLQFIIDLVFYWIPPMNEWKIVTPEWICKISNQVSVQLQVYLERFISSYYYQTLKDSINQILMPLQELYNNEFLQRFWIWCKPISEMFENRTDVLMNHPYAKGFGKLASYAYEMGIWAYDFLKIEDRARDLLGAIIARAEDVALFLVQEMILPEYHLPGMRNEIIFEPNNGKLEILQTLPVMWNSFTELPNLSASPEYRDVINLKDSLIRLPKASLNKLYQAMKSEFTWDHMVPSFRARALLVGDQHYMTFDGRAYEFAGECSYLLAHDFMDNNFTAIVKYVRDAGDVFKKSFTLILNGDTFELHQNLTITIDGQLKELPMTVGYTHISRNHNTITISNPARQVWVQYEDKYDTFMLEIGGFYHGKTAGLFGTYDHEPFNDFSTPQHEKMSNLEEFASSWEIGSKTCKSKKNYARLSSTNSYAIQKSCSDLFEEYGMLTPCLRKINPNPYKNMCINDVSVGKSSCAAAAAYAMMCRLNGVLVTLPDKCLHCEIGNMTIAQGDELTLEGAKVPQSTDVVFVIDNTWQCSTTFPNLRNRLSTISRNIEGALSGFPLTNNRYAVVGFGVGAPYSPKAITANGRIFTDLQHVDLALNNTHFAAGHHHQVAELIEFAAELPFRPAVGKVMIVVPCAEPMDLYKDYKKLASKLKEMDIVLHVTSIHEPILNAINKIKTDDIIGVDNKMAYMLNSAERGVLVGDKTVRQQMNIPRNTLTSLALDTNGSIFFASRLCSVQPAISKLATEMFSRRIAQNASPTFCQNCMCSTGSDGSPRALCSKCNSEYL